MVAGVVQPDVAGNAWLIGAWHASGIRIIEGLCGGRAFRVDAIQPSDDITAAGALGELCGLRVGYHDDGVCEGRCSGHKAAEIGRQFERWRWDGEEAIRVGEHALKPHDNAVIGRAGAFSEVPSNLLSSEEWHLSFWSKCSHQQNIMRLVGRALEDVFATPPVKNCRAWRDHCHHD